MQKLGKEPIIFSQGVIGSFVFLDSVASILLAVLKANVILKVIGYSSIKNSDISRTILYLEVDCVLLLLILDEVGVMKQKKNKTDFC